MVIGTESRSLLSGGSLARDLPGPSGHLERADAGKAPYHPADRPKPLEAGVRWCGLSASPRKPWLSCPSLEAFLSFVLP